MNKNSGSTPKGQEPKAVGSGQDGDVLTKQQRVKSSIDLISALDRHGKHGSALLIMGFPTATRAVPNSFPDRLKLLENLMQQGGIPVCIFTLKSSEDERGCLCCLLDERLADEWAQPYMMAVAEKVLTTEPWKTLSLAIGIDKFRIQK